MHVAGVTAAAVTLSLGAIGAVGAAAAPTAAARPTRVITAYVVNGDSGTMTPINTATNKAGRPIKVGLSPVAIAITP
jgi:YVTN family beta-propeller protein